MNPTQIADIIQASYPVGSVECAWDVLQILTVRRHGPDARLPRVQPPTTAPTWRQVLRMVCEHYDVPEAELLGRQRHARLAQARFALQTVMVERLGMAIQEVGRLTRRDWSSIRNAQRSLRRNADQWKTLNIALDLRCKQIEAAE